MSAVFVTSLTTLWSRAPTRTLQRVIIATKNLRRAYAGSISLSPDPLRWTGGTPATLSHRRRLVRAYVATLCRELDIAPWSDTDGPDPRGTRLDPEVSSFLRASASAASSDIPFARFPNFMVLESANLYLPVAFDGVFAGGPHVIGSAPRLADELRDLAGFLGLDMSQEAWWRAPALVEDSPKKRALSNLQVLGIACAQSADSSVPILVA